MEPHASTSILTAEKRSVSFLATHGKMRRPCRLSLPEALGDLCLDLASRQTDVVDQMGIGLRHSLELPAEAYPLAPCHDDALQSRQAVVPARQFRRLREGSIVHGNLHR